MGLYIWSYTWGCTPAAYSLVICGKFCGTHIECFLSLYECTHIMFFLYDTKFFSTNTQRCGIRCNGSVCGYTPAAHSIESCHMYDTISLSTNMQGYGVICNGYMCVTALRVAIHLQHILLVIRENFVSHKHHFDVGREVGDISCDMRVNHYDVPRLEYVCVIWLVILKHLFWYRSGSWRYHLRYVCEWLRCASPRISVCDLVRISWFSNTTLMSVGKMVISSRVSGCVWMTTWMCVNESVNVCIWICECV